MSRPPRNQRGLVMSSGRKIPKPADAPRRRAGRSVEGDDSALWKAAAELSRLASAIRTCEKCPHASGHRVFGSGYPLAPVMLVRGNAAAEDARDECAFTADAPSLERAFAALGIPFGWLYGTSAVKCGTDAASEDAVRACASHLLVEVEAVGPRVIVAFGDGAASAVRALDGRCGIEVGDDLPRSAATPLRRGLTVVVTEELPEGVRDKEAKRRLWRDLQLVPGLLGLQPVKASQ